MKLASLERQACSNRIDAPLAGQGERMLRSWRNALGDMSLFRLGTVRRDRSLGGDGSFHTPRSS